MIKIRINAHATQDRAKNRECNITVEYVNELLEKQDFKCYYCNNKVSAQNGNRDLDLLSIDRVNSNQGHIIGNCVISCLFCNLAKNDCDESTFKKFIEAIKKNEITDEMKEDFKKYEEDISVIHNTTHSAREHDKSKNSCP